MSGNPLSVIAIKSSLEHILTEDNYKKMIEMATVLKYDIQKIIDEFKLPWCVVQLGCRIEYWFCKTVPKNGSGAASAHDPLLYKYMHLFCLNRGILITPFHNMVLISPNTTYDDISYHKRVFKEAVEYLVNTNKNFDNLKSTSKL